MSIVELDVVVPHLADVRVTDVVTTDGRVRIEATPAGCEATCPGCGAPSRRVHSRYQRYLADPGLGGRPTTLCLTVRRFFCDVAACARKTFAEQVAGVTDRYARLSNAVRRLLEAVGLALGGRAGARLAAQLAVPAGRMTLLRLVRRIPDTPVTTAPRVLGVDDFALRRGHIYATILIDLETHRPVDVLPDREAATLADWLRAHPGAEIICRDRAGAYADGARTGAPQAVQVADRWHLWHNLAEAVEATVIRHRTALPEPPPPPEDAAVAPPDQPQPAAGTAETTPPEPTQPAAPHNPLVARTRERHAQVQQKQADGASISAISRTLRLDRHTVRRFARAASIDELLAKTTNRETLLDEFKPHLHQRFNDGHTDGADLYREIRQQGYRGSPQTVRRYLQPFRPTGTAPPATRAAPKIRQVVRWILTKPDNLDADQRQHLDAILARSPHLAAAACHVRSFAAMMNELAGHRLPDWITAVTGDDLPALHSFTTGIQRDLAAVTAGLTLPHSSGPVEGQVNRIKMLKRQMFGRANFDLLRARILHA